MKQKLFSKIVALLLLVSLLLIGTTSCGESATSSKAPTSSSTPTSGTPSQSEKEPADLYPTQLESLKGKTDGSTVSFIYVDGSGGYTAKSIFVNPEDGDIDDVGSGIIERNNKIYANYGITIDPIHASSVGIDGLQDYTKTMFDTQDNTIDVYCGYQYFDISLATQKHLYNLHELTNDEGDEIIDISKEYWATNYINSITYDDYLYWVTGDLTLRYTGGLYCTYVNTEIYDEKVRAAYDGKSIYEIVNEGQWFTTTMLDMIKLGANDFDGSGSITDGEIAGFYYQNNDIWDGLAFGCKVEFGKKVKNPNGSEEISITLGTDTKAASFASFCSSLYDSPYTLGVEGMDSVAQMEAFANGEALFVVNQIYQSPIYLSDMESFAIIPTPKLNKDQKYYASGCHDSLTIYGISRYSDVPQAAAVTLELMAYYGHTLVAPVFYESYILGGRTVREDESIEMINLIRKGFDSDFVAAWSNRIANIVHTFRTPSNCKSFKTYTRNMATRWPSNLNKLIEELEKASIVE